jgi:hypothetical protein
VKDFGEDGLEEKDFEEEGFGEEGFLGRYRIYKEWTGYHHLT